MANITIYSVERLKQVNFKIFKGLYNDFKSRAVSDYKFDLEPLEYEDFINAIEQRLLECLVLTENSIPTGFLIYTTLISFSVELNMIYLNSEENYDTKIRFLINDFLKREEDIIRQKVITYPLLGNQEKYKDVLAEFNFKEVSQSVLRFDFSNPSSIAKLNNAKNLVISDEYEITNWEDYYFDSAVRLIYDNFNTANDALFDSRFRTYDGAKDIITKLQSSQYGKFLPQYTKIAHKDGRQIGICFVNVTGDNLVNIPLVAVDRDFRNQNLGKKLVSLATKEVFEDTLNGINTYSEINVTTDTYNTSSMKMYEFCGFIEDYRYPQSYREPN